MPAGASEEDPACGAQSSKGFQLNLEGQEGVEQSSLSALRTCVNTVARNRRMLFGNLRETMEETGLTLVS